MAILGIKSIAQYLTRGRSTHKEGWGGGGGMGRKEGKGVKWVQIRKKRASGQVKSDGEGKGGEDKEWTREEKQEREKRIQTRKKGKGTR